MSHKNLFVAVYLIPSFVLRAAIAVTFFWRLSRAADFHEISNSSQCYPLIWYISGTAGIVALWFLYVQSQRRKHQNLIRNFTLRKVLEPFFSCKHCERKKEASCHLGLFCPSGVSFTRDTLQHYLKAHKKFMLSYVFLSASYRGLLTQIERLNSNRSFY